MNIDLTALFRCRVARCFGLSSPDLGMCGQSVAMPCRQALVGMARLTLLLAGLGIGGEVGAQTPDPMPSSATVSDSAEIEDYCVSLNISPICNLLASIVFSRTGDGDLRWDENHRSSLIGGGSISVLSPVVAAGDYSCMSLNFSPSLPADVNVFFHWALSRGGDSGSAHMQLFVAPPVDHVPMATTGTANFIQRSMSGFSSWSQYLAGTVDAAIPQLKWCYFGANPNPGNEDRGRIDRLRLNALSSVTDDQVIAEYCVALNINDCSRLSRLGFASPFRLADLAWDPTHVGNAPAGGGVSVASPPVSSEYSCMSIYLEPPLAANDEVSFEWSLSTRFRAFLRFYAYGLGEGGDEQPPVDNNGLQSSTAFRELRSATNGFIPWGPVKRTLAKEIGELRWCYFGSSSIISERDVSRIDRLAFGPANTSNEESFDDTLVLAEYCAALNMSEQLCGRLSGIVFSSNKEISRLAWDDRHADAPSEGGDRSVVSPTIGGASSYSCMSLRFAPAISADLGVSFAWSVGQGGSGTTRLQLFVAPPDGHDPALATTAGTGDFIERSEVGFSAWTSHLVPGLSTSSLSGGEPVSELKWCYFGESTSSRGRIDRLRLIVASQISERPMIAPYCTELGVSDEQCNFLQRVDFLRRGEAEERWQADSDPESMRILSAPVVTNEQYSCMSIRFEPAIFAGTNLSFTWSIAQSKPNSEPNKGQFWIDPDPMQEPEFDENGNTLESTGTESVVENFTVQAQSEVSDLRWCFFGGNPSPLSADALSLSALVLSIGAVRYDGREDINRYCSALDMPTSSCERLRSIVFTAPGQAEIYGGNLVWRTVEDAAPEGGDSAVAARFSNPYDVACMSLNFDPPWSAGTGVEYWYTINRLAPGPLGGLQLWLNPGPSHNPRSIDAIDPYAVVVVDSVQTEWNPLSLREFGNPIDEVKWCYFYGHNTHDGAVDRLAFGPDSSEETVSDTTVLGEYCEALNISDTVCARVSGIVFSRTGIGDLRWDENHSSAPSIGGGRSVLSPVVAAGDYSCMSLNFNPPLPPDLNIFFHWAPGGRGGPGPAAHMQLFVAPPEAHDPMPTMADTDDFIQRGEAGFSPWTRHLVGRVDAAIPQLKWCYFGAVAGSLSGNRGRLDRLRLSGLSSVTERPEIAQYCAALNIPEDQCTGISRIGFASPFRLADLTWDPAHVGGAPAGGGVSVASPPMIAAREEYSCMSLYFDPPLPQGRKLSFEWDLNRESGGGLAALRFYAYGLDEGDDDQPPIDNSGLQSSTAFRPLRSAPGSGGFAGWNAVNRTLGKEVGELRWCYFGANFPAGARDQGRIDRLVFGDADTSEQEIFSETAVLAQYCAALNMSERLCGRLSGIVFSGTGVSRLPWDEHHAVAPSRGGERSVISQAADENNYSCMSLYFDPPIPMHSDVSFDWSVGRAGVPTGDTRVSRLQLFVAPPTDHDPSLATTAGTADFIARLEDGFSAWTGHSVPRVSVPVPELKWCYFGADTTEFAGDRGRIDRLRLNVVNTIEERPVIERYCDALNVPEDRCLAISRLAFASPFRLSDFAWGSAHTGSPPAGSGISVASPMLSGSEYSCMSVYFDPPLPQNGRISFEWDLNREDGSGTASLHLYYFAPDEGDSQSPVLFDGEPATSKISRQLQSAPTSGGFAGWEAVGRTLGMEIGELRWCYFGANDTAGARDQGRIDRLVFGPADSSDEGSISDPMVLADYCEALNMSEQLCGRVSGIVFSGTGVARLPWDENYAEGSSGGGGRSVLSPIVSAGNYSCMSLRFAPLISLRSDVYFDWSVGSGEADFPGHLQLFVAPPDDHTPMASAADTANFIQYVPNPSPAPGDTGDATPLGFGPWRLGAARGVSAPVPELKWCYFGFGSTSVGSDTDRGRVDRLDLIVRRSFGRSDNPQLDNSELIAEYCTALDVPETQCARISRLVFAGPLSKDLRWDSAHAEGAPGGGGDSVVSPMISSREYSCMSVYFDPPVAMGSDIAFEWDISREPGFGSVRLRVWRFAPGAGDDHIPAKGALRIPNNYTIFGGGTLEGFQAWRTFKFRDLSAAVGELKWCYFGVSSTAGARDRGRVDRLAFGPADSGNEERFSEPAVLGEYCAALNMSEQLCGQLSSIVFSGTNVSRLSWDENHDGAPPGGGARSVLSPAVSAGNYSCMSLHFDPAISADLNVLFNWSVGRNEGSSGTAQLQLWAPPPENHVPMATTDTAGFIQRSEDGFSNWIQHVGRSESAIPELKWCYFGAGDSARSEDLGRIDRLRLAVSSTVEDRTVIDRYCTALNLPGAQCRQISHLAFSGPSGLQNVAWDSEHAAAAPGAGGDRSVLSQLVASGENSCMSVYFNPLLPTDRDVVFSWAPSRGTAASSENALLRFYFFAPGDGDDHVVGDGRSSDAFRNLRSGTSGFASWSRQSRTVPEAVEELKWCYSGGSPKASDQDVGRLDRLLLRADSESLSERTVLAEYCAALKMSAGLCVQLSRVVLTKTGFGGHVWDDRHAASSTRTRSVASPAVAAGRYSCMSLHFSPPITTGADISFDWSLGRSGDGGTAQLQLFLAPSPAQTPSAAADATGDFIRRSEEGFGAWMRHTVRTEDTVPELKWCYFGVKSAPTVEDIGRIDQLSVRADNASLSERATLAEYCTALNMSAPLCDQLSRIDFVKAGPDDGVVWDPFHAAGSMIGDDRSVASPAVGAGDYSCMSLYFSRPIPTSSDISFDWSLGRGGGSGNAQLQLFVAPLPDQPPMATTDGTANFIQRSEDGSGAWMPYTVHTEDTVPELKWCYFGMNSIPTVEDIGRIDRLAIRTDSESLSAPAVLQEYCDALNMPAPICARLSRIDFVKTGPGDHIWEHSPAEALAIGNRSAVSPVVAAGDYSCMSLRFDPPFPADSAVSFSWSLGRGGGSGSSRLQLFLNPPIDRVPMATTDNTSNFIQQSEDGFGDTEQHGARSEAPITAIQWCYFGANPDPVAEDRGRLATLRIHARRTVDDRPVIDRYCLALNVPEAQCSGISRIAFGNLFPDANLAWDSAHAAGAPGGGGVSAASPKVSGSEYSCMSVYFDPPLAESQQNIAFEWAVGREMGFGQLRLLARRFAPGAGYQHIPEKGEGGANYSIYDGREPAGFRPWRRQSFGNLPTAIGELKWCYFGTNPTAGELDRGRVDRLVFGLANTSNEENFSDSAVLAEYCVALNMSARLCGRLSGIVFSGTGVGRLPWDDRHADSPSGGGGRSVLSPAVSKGNYSCMSLRFAPPISGDLNVHFDWSVGRDGVAEGDTRVSRLQLFVAPPPGHVPRVTTNGTTDFIERLADGFSAWTAHLLPRGNAPIPELKWCYFGADTSTAAEDRGRIDRLRLNALSSVTERPEIEQYCIALNTPENQCSGISRIGFTGPFRLEDLTWDHTHTGSPPAGGGVSVASPMISGSEYSCLSVYFDEPLPVGSEISFEWALNRQSNTGQDAFLRFYLYGPDEGGDEQPPIDNDGFQSSTVFRDLRFVTGDGGFARWSVVRRTLSEAAGELRWCYFGSGSIARERDLGRIDRLVFGPAGSGIEGRISDSAVLADYCAALSMSARLCERVSGIVFSGTGPSSLPWDPNHAVAPSGGGGRSVISQAVDENNYSCMSLRFDPPIPMNSDVSFDWSVGRAGVAAGDTRVSRLQLFVAPPADHDPALATTDGTADFIERLEDGFSAWTGHSVPRVSAPVPELKWCYFGADTTNSLGDRGRIDRLRLNVSSSTEDRTVIARYCTALNVPEDRCIGISRIGFAGPFRLDDSAWDSAHAVGAPAGGGVSVASPMVSNGEYSCMSLYFDPPLPPNRELRFEWDLNREDRAGTIFAFLRFYRFHPGDGDDQGPIDSNGRIAGSNAFRSLRGGLPNRFDGWEAVRRTPGEATGELRWCYFGANATAGTLDQGRIDRLVLSSTATSNENEDSFSDPAVLAEYCAALNMSAPLCGRLSGIVFSGTGVGRLPWDENHAVAPSGGGDRSVISQAVDENNYSCMSLRFDPPIPMNSDVSFDWSVGRAGVPAGDTRVSRLQLFVAPPADHDPSLVTVTTDTTDFIERLEDGFSAWTAHLLPRGHAPIPELKWCYFGADTTESAGDRGRIDRLRLNVSSSTEDRTVIARYCTALNVPGAQCRQISRLAFASPLRKDFAWDSEHAVGAPDSGGVRSVISPMISNREYSCMSLYFEPPVPEGRDIVFDWDISREPGFGSARLRTWRFAPGGGDQHIPEKGALGIPNNYTIFGGGTLSGFQGWRRFSFGNPGAEVGELKWCYFGANATAGARDQGRIDRLLLRTDRESLSERAMLEAYCAALNMSAPLCARLASVDFVKTGTRGHIWDDRHAASSTDGDDRSVASPVVAAGDYSCLSLQFSPSIAAGSDISFDWSLGRSGDGGTARLQLFLAPPPDHNPLTAATDDDAVDFIRQSEDGFGVWMPHSVRNISTPAPELKWCYFGVNAIPNVEDIGRIDRLSVRTDRKILSERAVLEEYCTALNMSVTLCDRLSRIAFAKAGPVEFVWDPLHAASSVVGDDRSVASPVVAAGNYSCMSLHFSPPIAMGSDISFDWSLGRSAGSGTAQLQLFVAPPPDHDPLMTTTDTSDFIQWSEGGFSAWTPHSVPRVSAPVAELKWCYFGAGSSKGTDDRGRIDRLRLDVESSAEGRPLIAGYCNALSLPEAHCQRIDRIVFFDPVGVEGLAWDVSPEVGAPGSRDVSLVARRSSCMSLVFDPPWPPFADVSFWWDVGSSAGTEPAGLRLELNLDNENFFALEAPGDPVGGDHTRVYAGEGFAGWLRYRRNDFPEPLEQLRWCYRSGRTTPQPQDRARFALLQLQEDKRLSLVGRAEISPYCEALNMPDWNCERIRYISFDSSDQPRQQWDGAHPMGSPNGGGDISVASPLVAQGGYSCLSLHFDPPLAADSRLRFAWSAGRSGSAESTQMRLWLNPGYGHSPLAPARGPVLDYDSGGAWQSSATADIDVAVREAKWCVLGANQNPSPNDIGRLDVVRFGPYRELISERDRLDEYCAASGLEGMDCALLSRIAFSGAGPAESVWAIREPYGLSSPRGSPGEESCMRMEFAAPAAAVVGRFVFGWSLTGPADSRLRVYRGGEARPVLEFAPSDAGGPGSFPTATVWVPRSADAPNYLLSWCYYLPEDAGADSVAARATVLGISLQQLRSELTVTAPMGGNRRVELAEYLAHALRVDISLGDVLGMAQPELVPAVVRLNSVADMVYQMSAGTLQPLDWRMSLEFGSHTSTTTLYLPQAVVAREQQFRLFSADGVLLAKTSITVPAVIAEDSSATLAINRLCRGGRLLAAEAAMTNCPLLALPGNGFGDWMTASTTASVTHLAPNSLEVAAVAGPSRCLRMLVGVSASRQESSAVQIRFRWRGPPPGSGVELGFYIGQSDVAVALAPSSGTPVSGSLLLTQRPEGQQLGWCLEGSSSLASAMGSDWGWFPVGPDGFLLRAVGIAPLTANVLLVALPYLQECTEQGRRSLPVCLQMIGDVPESLKQHLGLAGDVVITEEIILLWSTLQWLTERGELDVDRDGDQDEHDLRLWLRYQAGLRGEALSRDPVDEARLVERLGSW